mgnify:CR=1 FL=1
MEQGHPGSAVPNLVLALAATVGSGVSEVVQAHPAAHEVVQMQDMCHV